MAFGYIMLLVILIMPLMMVGFGLLLMKNPPKKKTLTMDTGREDL